MKVVDKIMTLLCFFFSLGKTNVRELMSFEEKT
jgi:hypothetical protein